VTHLSEYPTLPQLFLLGIFGSVFNSFKGGLGNRNFEKKGQNSRPNNFRIPKFNKNNSAQGTRGDKTAGR
jgi:hypothetical protein